MAASTKSKATGKGSMSRDIDTDEVSVVKFVRDLKINSNSLIKLSLINVNMNISILQELIQTLSEIQTCNNKGYQRNGLKVLDLSFNPLISFEGAEMLAHSLYNHQHSHIKWQKEENNNNNIVPTSPSSSFLSSSSSTSSSATSSSCDFPICVKELYINDCDIETKGVQLLTLSMLSHCKREEEEEEEEEESVNQIQYNKEALPYDVGKRDEVVMEKEEVENHYIFSKLCCGNIIIPIDMIYYTEFCINKMERRKLYTKASVMHYEQTDQISDDNNDTNVDNDSNVMGYDVNWYDSIILSTLFSFSFHLKYLDLSYIFTKREEKIKKNTKEKKQKNDNVENKFMNKNHKILYLLTSGLIPTNFNSIVKSQSQINEKHKLVYGIKDDEEGEREEGEDDDDDKEEREKEENEDDEEDEENGNMNFSNDEISQIQNLKNDLLKYLSPSFNFAQYNNDCNNKEIERGRIGVDNEDDNEDDGNMNYNLKILKISNSFLDDIGVACISNIIEKLPFLIELDMSCNDITGYGLCYLLSKMNNTCMISNFNISFNPIGLIGITALTYSLIPTHTSSMNNSRTNSNNSRENSYDKNLRNPTNSSGIGNLHSRTNQRIRSDGTYTTQRNSNKVNDIQLNKFPNNHNSSINMKDEDRGNNNNNIECLSWMNGLIYKSYLNLSLLTLNIDLVLQHEMSNSTSSSTRNHPFSKNKNNVQKKLIHKLEILKLKLTHCGNNHKGNNGLFGNLMPYLSKLLVLDVSHTCMKNQGAWVFAHALQAGAARQLYSLDISGNKISEVGKSALGLAIIRAETIHECQYSNHKQSTTLYDRTDKGDVSVSGVNGSSMRDGNLSSNSHIHRKTMFQFADLQHVCCDEIKTGNFNKRIDNIEKINEKNSDNKNSGGVNGNENSNTGKESSDVSDNFTLDFSKHCLESADLIFIAGLVFRHKTIQRINLDNNVKVGHAAPKHAHGPIPTVVGATDLGGLCALEWKRKYLGKLEGLEEEVKNVPLYDVPLPLTALFNAIESNGESIVTTESMTSNNLNKNTTVDKDTKEEDNDTSQNIDSSDDDNNINISVSEDKNGNVVKEESLKDSLKMPPELNYDGLSTLFSAIELSCPSLKSLSINYIEIGNTQALSLIELLRKKQGFIIESYSGNETTLRSRVLASLHRNIHRSLQLEVEISPIKVVKLHLLGHSKVGKSTIRQTLDQTRISTLFSKNTTTQPSSSSSSSYDKHHTQFQSHFQNHINHHLEGELEDSGVQVANVTLPGGLGSVSPMFSVWDYSGLATSRGLHAMNFLSSPNSLYAIVVSLALPSMELRKQVKYWLLLLISSLGLNKVATSPLILIGTKGDSYGKLGSNILASYLSVAKAEIVKELNIDLDMLNCMIETSNELNSTSRNSASSHSSSNNRGVWSNDNAAFFSIDARSVDHRFNAFRSHLITQHASIVQYCSNHSMMGSIGFKLYEVVSSKVKEWRTRGATVLRFDEFAFLCRSEVSPSSDEVMLISTARMLHHIGDILFIEQEYDPNTENGNNFNDENNSTNNDNKDNRGGNSSGSNNNIGGDKNSGNSTEPSTSNPIMKRWIVLDPNAFTFGILGSILAISSPNSKLNNEMTNQFFNSMVETSNSEFNSNSISNKFNHYHSQLLQNNPISMQTSNKNHGTNLRMNHQSLPRNNLRNILNVDIDGEEGVERNFNSLGSRTPPRSSDSFPRSFKNFPPPSSPSPSTLNNAFASSYIASPSSSITRGDSLKLNNLFPSFSISPSTSPDRDSNILSPTQTFTQNRAMKTMYMSNLTLSQSDHTTHGTTTPINDMAEKKNYKNESLSKLQLDIEKEPGTENIMSWVEPKEPKDIVSVGVYSRRLIYQCLQPFISASSITSTSSTTSTSITDHNPLSTLPSRSQMRARSDTAVNSLKNPNRNSYSLERPIQSNIQTHTPHHHHSTNHHVHNHHSVAITSKALFPRTFEDFIELLTDIGFWYEGYRDNAPSSSFPSSSSSSSSSSFNIHNNHESHQNDNKNSFGGGVLVIPCMMYNYEEINVDDVYDESDSDDDNELLEEYELVKSRRSRKKKKKNLNKFKSNKLNEESNHVSLEREEEEEILSELENNVCYELLSFIKRYENNGDDVYEINIPINHQFLLPGVFSRIQCKLCQICKSKTPLHIKPNLFIAHYEPPMSSSSSSSTKNDDGSSPIKNGNENNDRNFIKSIETSTCLIAVTFENPSFSNTTIENRVENNNNGEFVICAKGKLTKKQAYELIIKIRQVIESICYDYSDLMLDDINEDDFTIPLNCNNTGGKEEEENDENILNMKSNNNNDAAVVENDRLNNNHNVNNNTTKDINNITTPIVPKYVSKEEQMKNRFWVQDKNCGKCIRKFKGKIRTNRLPYEIMIENMDDISFHENKGRACIISINNPNIITHHYSDLKGKLLPNGINGLYVTAIYKKPWEYFLSGENVENISNISYIKVPSPRASSSHHHQHSSSSSSLNTANYGQSPPGFLRSYSNASSKTMDGTDIESENEQFNNMNPQELPPPPHDSGGGGVGNGGGNNDDDEVLLKVHRDINGFVSYSSLVTALRSGVYPLYLSLSSSTTITPPSSSSSSSSSSSNSTSNNLKNKFMTFDLYQTLVCTNRASLPSSSISSATSSSNASTSTSVILNNTFELSGAESIEDVKMKNNSIFDNIINAATTLSHDINFDHVNDNKEERKRKSSLDKELNNNNDEDDENDEDDDDAHIIEGGGWLGGEDVKWYLSTVLISEHVPLLGKDLFIDYHNMATCGWSYLTSKEVSAMLKYSNTMNERKLNNPTSSGIFNQSPHFYPSSSSSSSLSKRVIQKPFSENRSLDINSSSTKSHISHQSNSAKKEVKKKSSVLVYIHGFNTTPYFVSLNSALYFRTMGSQLVVAVTWPSAPKPASGVGLVSLFISGSMDQPYAIAFNHMQASVKTFSGLAEFIKKSTLIRRKKQSLSSSSSTNITSSTTLLKDENSSLKGSGGGEGVPIVEEEDIISMSNIYWKAHSMGSHLLLSIIERMHWTGNSNSNNNSNNRESHIWLKNKSPQNLSFYFNKIILDAPDVPLWFFREKVKLATDQKCRILHLFNPEDRAVDASRIRREPTDKCPGNDAVVTHPFVEAVDCRKAIGGSTMNHDYGRRDGFCIMDQADFLSGLAPNERQLTFIPATPSSTQHWLLRTGR